MKTYNVEYCNEIFTLTDEEPKTGDRVLTKDYGVWDFHEGTAPLPYWCNPNTCNKIVSSTKIL
jgi:hypothetical protein